MLKYKMCLIFYSNNTNYNVMTKESDNASGVL